MTDMTERAFYQDLDDMAADFWTVTADDQYAPGFDEWNALRLAHGQRPGSFTEYMQDVAPLLADDSNQW